MDALKALHTRVSVPRLQGPGPEPEQLHELLHAALRAPDHGLLRPWRFVVLEGSDRERFGKQLEALVLEDNPDADDATCAKARDHATRAPVMIAVVAEIEPDHPKAPRIEQVMATATAVENMMVAAHARGLGAMWRTGAWARDARVKRVLGFAEKDEIVAFLFLGQPAGATKAVPELRVDDYRRTLP